MSIGQSLSRLVLQRLADDVGTFGGADAMTALVDLLTRHSREDDPPWSAALRQALERAWRALEVALADDPFWDHGQVGLSAGDAQSFRQRLETVLAELAQGGAVTRQPGATAVETALRHQCLWELRAAREAGALAGHLDADEWAWLHEVSAVVPDLAEGEWVRELERQGCVGLMRLLTGSAGLPLLARVGRAFVCQELGRWLRGCRHDHSVQAAAAVLADALRQLDGPCFSGLCPTVPDLQTPTFDTALDIAVPPVPTPTRSSVGSRRPHPRRIDPRRFPPLARSSAPLRQRPPWVLLTALALGVLLLLILPIWFLIAQTRAHTAEQRRGVAERRKRIEERRRFEMGPQRLLDEQRRRAEDEAARRRAAERQRQEDEGRRAEAEEERQRAAARDREEERRRHEEERRTRLREQKEKKERAEVLLDRGLTHAACRRDEQALLAFTEALELDPDLVRAWTERGLVRRRRRDAAGALADFGEAIRRDPRDLRAWLHRAELHAARHDNSLAIEDFTAVLRLEPDNARAYRERGACYVRNADYDNALADESVAIDLTPGDPWPYYYRANVHHVRNDRVRAFADYSAAIARDRDGDPGLAPAYRVRGTISLDREEYGQAIADLTRALERDAWDVAARQTRGLAYLKMGDWNSAAGDADAVIQRDPQNVDAYKMRGQAYLALQEYRKAHADFTRAIGLQRTDAEAYFLRARAALRSAKSTRPSTTAMTPLHAIDGWRTPFICAAPSSFSKATAMAA